MTYQYFPVRGEEVGPQPYLFFVSINLAEYYSRLVIAVPAVLAACLLPVSRRLVPLGAWALAGVAAGGGADGVNENGLDAARDIAADHTMGYRMAGVLTETPPGMALEWPVWRTADRREAIAQ